MDLLTHVPGVNITGSFTPGASTPSPYNVAHIGGVDGTGPQNATKNMAEIYNRLLLDRAALIQMAGLSVDNNNWVQAAQAAVKIAGGLDGGLCPNTGPATAPTTANPYTMYTGTTTGEKWVYLGGAWCVAAKPYGVEFANASLACVAAVQQTFSSQVMPRNGKIAATLAMIGGATAAGHKALCWIAVNAQTVAGDTALGAATADQIWVNAAQELDVLAGDIVTFVVFSSNTQVIPTRGGFRYLS